MTDVDVSRYIKIMWRWAWLIVLAAVIAGGVSYRVSQFLPRIYRSSTTLMVGDFTSNPNVSQEELQTSQRLATTYSQMLQREPILAATVTALALPTDWQELKPRVLVSHVDGNQFIEIRVVDSDPQRAKAITDELIRQIVLQSPTQAVTKDLDQRHEFVRQELQSLQSNITDSEKILAAKQDQVQKADSARAVLDLQDEIKALDSKLTAWRSTYASLLSASQGKPANTLSVIEPPSVETQPVSPNVRSNVLLAAALGALLAVAAICAVEYLNDALDDDEDLSRIIPSPILGSLEYAGRIKTPMDALVTALDPYAPISEGYRLLRTNILAATADDGLVPLVITSPSTSEGKSFTSANLAVSFAQSGRTVILVDADIRLPTLHTMFSTANEVGLTTVLTVESIPPEHGSVLDRLPTNSPGQQLEALIERCLTPTHVPGLRLLPSGPLLANPAELLGSSRMSQVLRILQRMADVVILDSPPVLPVADATLLAGKWAAVLLVLEVGRSRAEDLRQAYETLQRNRSRVLGAVRNKVRNMSRGKGRYYRYYRPAASNGARGLRLPFVRRAETGR